MAKALVDDALWELIHPQVLLAKLQEADQIDWSRSGEATDPNVSDP